MGITLQNITKTYDKAKQPVLNDVNAEIQDGELFVIVGHPVVVKVRCCG